MLETGQSGQWNFGPRLDRKHSVSELVECFAKSWGVVGNQQPWKLAENVQPHEAGYLLLDSSKARETLGWNDKLDFKLAIEMTVEWFKKVDTESPREVTTNQIREFLAIV
jgi:CDP-glucose 4,6-dehydratase